MNPVLFGLQFRALRLRHDLRQADLGERAAMSRAVISRIERGLLRNVQLGTLERAAAAMGGTIDLRLRWRGEQLDRLVDEAHAALVERVVALLRRAGWELVVEASYSIWGERGSVDVLGYRQSAGLVLVVEVKSVVPDSQATLVALDRKARLAATIAAERGWNVAAVSRLLVVGDSATSRRRVARLDHTYRTSFPIRGPSVRQWLRSPVGTMSGLLFLSFAPQGSRNTRSLGRIRVRKRGRVRHPPIRVATAPPESERSPVTAGNRPAAVTVLDGSE